MKKIIIFCVISIISGISVISGQDIHFSQFNNTPLIINPALTGVFNGNHRVFLNYKDQWRSIGAPYKTYAISYDVVLFKEKWKNSDDTYGVEKSLLDVDRIIIENLELIKKELVPNCRHPKKMRGKAANGQLYCMNCNLDL